MSILAHLFYFKQLSSILTSREKDDFVYINFFKFGVSAACLSEIKDETNRVVLKVE
nr:MAG TPA: hypothetical protein [Caudoviricetes sp.]